jgi:hypothetical protein
MNLVKKLNLNCCSFNYSYSTNLNMEQYSYLNILHNIMFSNVHTIQNIIAQT